MAAQGICSIWELTLQLNLVLNDQGLASVVNLVRQLGRDGMVGSLRLCDEALVTLDNRDDGLLDLPLADVAKRLTADGGLLGRL